jgi:hypothetical protein
MGQLRVGVAEDLAHRVSVEALNLKRVKSGWEND